MYDLIVIGAGPGGYCAAEHAVKKGKKTAIFEAQDLGGVCLNWGCIPTKSLLYAAELLENIKNADSFGITIDSFSIDIKRMVEQSRTTVTKLNSGISFLLKGVDIFKSYAKVSKVTANGNINEFEVIDAAGKIYKSKHVILATGGRQRPLPNVEFSKRVWDVKSALTPQSIPKRMAVIGAGAIGIEFANFYALLGTEVIVYEMAPTILAGVDKQIAEFLQKKLEKLGIKFVLEANSRVQEKADCVEVTIDKNIEQFDCALVAIGVIPNCEDFPQVEKIKGYFKTNQIHETNIKNLFAIGDCAAPPWLAHKATAEGIRVVNYIFDDKQPSEMEAVPMCIYTHPQVASIGETEDDLHKKFGSDFSKHVKIGIAHFYGNGKAVAIKDADGFIKVLIDSKRHEILGVHMVGPQVTEMIQGISIAIASEAIADNILDSIFPHPTISETLHEAFAAAIHSK